MPGASQTRKMGRDPSNSRCLSNRNSISFQQKQTYQEHYGLATAAGMPAKAGDLTKKGCQQQFTYQELNGQTVAIKTLPTAGK